MVTNCIAGAGWPWHAETQQRADYRLHDPPWIAASADNLHLPKKEAENEHFSSEYEYLLRLHMTLLLWGRVEKPGASHQVRSNLVMSSPYFVQILNRRSQGRRTSRGVVS